jgi:hypothetical protein
VDPQRADLEVLRAGLLESFATADDSVRAQLAGQLRAVIKDLAALGEVAGEVTAADEIAARRKARLSDADDSSSASRRGQSRRSNGSHRSS